MFWLVVCAGHVVWNARAMSGEAARLLAAPSVAAAGAPPETRNTYLKMGVALFVAAALAVAGTLAPSTAWTALAEPLRRPEAAGAVLHSEYTTFAPQCEEDLRHNSCGAFGDFCPCKSLRPGVGPATARALALALKTTNVFLVGDSTSKMMVQHGCRTLIDPLSDPHGASCFREDGMPTVFAQPSNLRPISPEPSDLADDASCCVGDGRAEGHRCCMTMLESMVGSYCGRRDENGDFGGIGFVHMASSFKDTFEMPCEYKFGRDLPLKFQARAAAAMRHFARAVATGGGRQTTIIIDVNVWMGMEIEGATLYENIIKMTRNAISAAGLAPERTSLMMKTLYECGDEGSWHCERNNELIRRAAADANVPLFDFANTFQSKGLSPRTALREDGIHQMPDTALFEMYSMLEFVAKLAPGAGMAHPGDAAGSGTGKHER